MQGQSRNFMIKRQTNGFDRISMMNITARYMSVDKFGLENEIKHDQKTDIDDKLSPNIENKKDQKPVIETGKDPKVSNSSDFLSDEDELPTDYEDGSDYEAWDIWRNGQKV